jgi:hypothetical protein
MGHNILLTVLFGGARFGCCKQSLASLGVASMSSGRPIARTIQISRTAPMKPAPKHVAPNEQLTIDLYQNAKH